MSEETRKLFQEVKVQVEANTARLNGCPGPRHDFTRDEAKFFSKWTCTICQGRVDVSAVHWYNRGVEHAKR